MKLGLSADVFICTQLSQNDLLWEVMKRLGPPSQVQGM